MRDVLLLGVPTLVIYFQFIMSMLESIACKTNHNIKLIKISAEMSIEPSGSQCNIGNRAIHLPCAIYDIGVFLCGLGRPHALGCHSYFYTPYIYIAEWLDFHAILFFQWVYLQHSNSESHLLTVHNRKRAQVHDVLYPTSNSLMLYMKREKSVHTFLLCTLLCKCFRQCGNAAK